MGAADPSSSSHEIDSCTTITDPGEYEIVADIEPDEEDGPTTGGCIEIRADDVTVYGNGHLIDGRAALEADEPPGGIGVGVNTGATRRDPLMRLENVTVTDVRVTGFDTGIRYEEVSGGEIGQIGARENRNGIGLHFGVVRLAIHDNALADGLVGLWMEGDPDVFGGPNGNAVEHNDVETNGVGIRFGHEAGGNDVVRNRIVNNGNGASHSAIGAAGTYRKNVICRNEHYGILNQDLPAIPGDLPAFADVVDARDNYWGAADGPSSFGEPSTPFADPETARLADGGGDAISQGLDPGVANVRFDPFLESAPEDAGVRG